MGGLRRNRCLIACLAIFGLMLNLAAGMLCCLPKNAAAAADLSLFGDGAICTHDGSGAPRADEQPPPHPHVKPCPLCLTAANVALVAAFAAVFAVIEAPAQQWIA